MEGFEERVRASFARQGLMAYLGAKLARIEPGLVEIELPFRAELGQQHGYFHAGAIGAVLDSAGGYAAYTLMPATHRVLSVEYKLNFLAPGDGEAVLARGRVVRAGRTLTVCELHAAVVKQGKGTLCATGTQTLISVEAKPGQPPG